MRKGMTLIEMLVTLIVATIVIEMAWNVFGQSAKQFSQRQVDSDSLKTQWISMRSNWRWIMPPDSIKGRGDSCLFVGASETLPH